MDDANDAQKSRRAFTRATVELAVTVVTVAGQEQYGQALNIGQGGMFIETLPLDVGERVSLAFYLPDLEEPVHAVATVKWNNEDGRQGIGVQFDPLRALEVWAINKIFERERQAAKESDSL